MRGKSVTVYDKHQTPCPCKTIHQKHFFQVQPPTRRLWNRVEWIGVTTSRICCQQPRYWLKLMLPIRSPRKEA